MRSCLKVAFGDHSAEVKIFLVIAKWLQGAPVRRKLQLCWAFRYLLTNMCLFCLCCLLQSQLLNTGADMMATSVAESFKFGRLFLHVGNLV